MIILHNYSFQNIRSFLDKQTISLDNRDKLVQFDGENRNTGGSSGSGKSTALIAIDYLLGFSDIPSTVLQTWITKDDMLVEGNFTIGGVKTHMSRSKKKGFTIKYGEEEFSGKLAEEKLWEIIDIPKDIFKQMIHKKQDQRGFFLNKTAKQMYEFLVEMLGLELYEKKQQKISEHIKVLVKNLEDYNLQIANAESRIKELDGLLLEKTMPVEPDVSSMNGLKIQQDELSKKLSAVSAQKHEALKLVKKPQIPEKTNFDTSKWQQAEVEYGSLRSTFQNLEIEIQNLNKKIHGIELSKSELKTLATQAVENNKKIQELSSNVCYTCKQHYSGKDAEIEKTRLNDSVGELKKKINFINEDLKTLPALYKEIESKKLQLRDIGVKKDEVSKTITEERMKKEQHDKAYQDMVEKLNMSAKNKELEISNKWDSAINKMQQELKSVEFEISKLESEISSYETAKQTYERESRSLQEKIDSYKKEHVDLHIKVEREDKELKVAEEALRLIKNYTIQIFQDTLNIIGDTASDMISNIPNIQNSSIYFEGCKETKSGAIKDEVTPIINLNGHNKIPVKAFSGGEKTAIELAVDLAVIDVVESRAGKGANFFILDEPFNGLDSVCKESCLEVLKQYDTNKKIIMVDHSSELKEMVSDVITVVKEGEVSFIQ